LWIGLLGLPFAMSTGLGSFSAGDTIVALMIAYCVGHLLAGLARNLFPSQKYADGHGRYKHLSDLQLDPAFEGVDALSRKMWTLLQEKVQDRFDLDIADEAERKGVFFLCRTALAQAKASPYVEQYQGLLSLTRSLSAACLFALCFYAGW